MIKIGHTTDTVERRIKNYTTHASEPTELVGYVFGTLDTERGYHARFNAHRERGEWFRLEGSLAAFISDDLPRLQDETERVRDDQLKQGLDGTLQKLPRKVPRKTPEDPVKLRRKLSFRNGQIFDIKGKRVLSPQPGDYFV